ncbi:TlpA family protein disulfide reductase [Flavobacterium litorale]|uniref:Thioredoxin family protein n=1 Tax=Flavobacterium litorale TaxID=2856519 RepID=A0ABX8V4M2_9FLAO|nr:thioredoxin-like domain-containing protein [Flavobacterium litorale]QYJ67745.1 thioredoxin family protein [Flavobacterium litorale]
MGNIFKKLFLLSLLFTLMSCDNEDDNYTAYFGGEVISPRSPYVIFSKDKKAIDTIPLDKNNRFFIKFDSLAPGMYSFRHEPEYQYIYFDKNDSIMVSVNAENFDQSLAFSGRGEKKNNFLMELYLLNEADRINSYRVYEKDYKDFIKEIDASYTKRAGFYNKNKKQIDWSEDFDVYAKTRLKFSQYTKKEHYPHLHNRRRDKKINLSLPNNYYSYRDSIDFNNKKLTAFSPFIRYTNAMLNNMAAAKMPKGKYIEDRPLRENIIKLKLADSIFNDEKIKNDILNNIAFSYLLEDQNIHNNKKFLAHYMELSTDNDSENEIMKIGNAIDDLESGNKLPEVALVDTNNNSFDIDNDIDKETVIYFWTTCSRSHLKMVNRKVTRLKKEFPNVNFIAINLDEDPEWKKIVTKTNFDKALQLRATSFQILKDKWVITKLNRTIILNADGTIKNGFTNLMHQNFKKDLGEKLATIEIANKT